MFICSPLRPRNGHTFEDDIDLVRQLCHVATQEGYAAFAPHLFYTLFLDDKSSKERALWMAAGHCWLRVCDVVGVYANELGECSEGMLEEITIARRQAVTPEILWMPEMFQRVVRRRSGSPSPEPLIQPLFALESSPDVVPVPEAVDE